MIQAEGSRGGGVTRSLPLQHPHLGQDVCEHKVGQSATQLRTPKPGVSWILWNQPLHFLLETQPILHTLATMWPDHGACPKSSNYISNMTLCPQLPLSPVACVMADSTGLSGQTRPWAFVRHNPFIATLGKPCLAWNTPVYNKHSINVLWIEPRSSVPH